MQQKEEIHVTINAQATELLGETVARARNSSQNIFLLYGDLGSGKTTFTKGFAKALEISHHIQSPTFLIIRTYELEFKRQNSKFPPKARLARGGKSAMPRLNWDPDWQRPAGQNLKFLYHVDLYRIQSEEDVVDLGLVEIMKDPDNIVIIEWPEKLGSLLPENSTAIYFEYVDEDKRKITVKSFSN